MTDEALKELLAEQILTVPAVTETVVKEVLPVNTASIKKWLTLHPKVQAAFVALALVAALNGQGAYDGTESPREAVHRTVGAVIVALVAYLKKSNGGAV